MPRNPSRFHLGTIGVIALGGVLHVGLLLTPQVLLGNGYVCVTDPRCLALLVAATVFYLAETSRSWWPDGSRHNAPARAVVVSGQPSVGRLALATGLALLLLQWTALTTRGEAAGPMGRLAVAMSILGVAMMLGGSTLRLVAIRCLGRFFVTELIVTDDQSLVTDGPYRRIRHPSETGLLVHALGVCVLMQSPWAVLLWAVLLLPLTLVRVRLEDRHLAEVFGTSFARHARDAGCLLPRLKPGRPG